MTTNKQFHYGMAQHTGWHNPDINTPHVNYSHSLCPQLLSTRSRSFVIMLVVAQHNKTQTWLNGVTGSQTQCHTCTINPLLHTRSSSLISEVQYHVPLKLQSLVLSAIVVNTLMFIRNYARCCSTQQNPNLVVTGCQTQCHTFNPCSILDHQVWSLKYNTVAQLIPFVNFNVVQGSNTMPHIRLLLPPAVVVVQHNKINYQVPP